MATENPPWGYMRIQGALKNLDHRVGRSTIAPILRAEGIPPGRQRPMTWRTFVQAHGSALVAADFFTNYAHLGLAELAERAGERALEINPTSAYAKRQLISSYKMSAQRDKRLTAQLRWFPNEPMDGWALLTVGRLKDARRAVDLGVTSDGAGQLALARVKALLDALQGDMRSAKAAIPSLLSWQP